MTYASELVPTAYYYLSLYAQNKLRTQGFNATNTATYLRDLQNSKLDDITDLIPPKIIAYLKDVNIDAPVFYTLYVVQDEQDDDNFHIHTLQEARQWLADFWNNYPDDDMNDEEHEELLEAILNSDAKELDERLQGIDYWMEELS